jgi:peptidoglycan/xylan/chitin deacetylase (PgdA/CDA1 family)
VVEAPSARRVRRRYLLAGIALLTLLALVGGFSATRPVPVTIDGAPQRLSAGATAGDLLSSDALAAGRGDLVSVKGDVLTPGGGRPPVVLRNGEAVTASTRLYGGDDIVSLRGADSVESLEVTLTTTAYKTVYSGKGSLSELTTEGVPGQVRIIKGALSGAEVSRVVLSEPVDAVVMRMSPKPGSKMIALTFDDGPWPVYTEKILDVLAKHDTKATFFMLGLRAKRKPDVAARVANEGHLVANHSLSHRSFATSKPKEIKRQIVKGREVIKDASGVDSPWLRPPYGAMGSDAWKIAKKTHSRVVRWSVDSEDWHKRGAKKIAKRVIKQVEPGSVILMHDGGGDRSQTVEALPMIIEKLKAKGYVFVTVEELYAINGTSPSKK